MGSPRRTHTAGKQPEKLSPSGSLRRRSSSVRNTPEFEFCLLGNPSQPSLDLLSADELFLDGVLLPLDLLRVTKPHRETNRPDPDQDAPPDPEPESVPGRDPNLGPNESVPITGLTASKPETGSGSEPGPELTREPAPTSGLTASKRWRDIIFKKSEKRVPAKNTEEQESKKREKKGRAASGSGTAELNINIWPFSRSRSAGNSVTRPRASFGAPTRRVSSAPCSRSNSAGESKSRKWPSSPGRIGVHLGRSSPVWQVNRTGSVRSGRKEINETRRGKTVNRLDEGCNGGGASNNNNKAKVLNLNAPTCIGYRSRLSCRGDESGSSNVGSGNRNNVGGDSNAWSDGSNSLFGLLSHFAKKVY